MTGSNQTTSFDVSRSVIKKFLVDHHVESNGAIIRKVIGRNGSKSLDPFVQLDHFSLSPGVGFPDHPHRGFESVTYMLEGSFSHQVAGEKCNTIHTGDVQWTTAGKGMIHSETHAGEGVSKGLQLWINLSSKDKMIEPKCEEVRNKEVKTVEKDGVKIGIISGESMGVKSIMYTKTPIMYLDCCLNPGAKFYQKIPKEWNSFVYVIEGEGVFGSIESSSVEPHHVVVLGSGDGVSVWNKSLNRLRFVLVGGEPINEPVVQYGPFVMCTQDEIDETIKDYRSCRNGFEMAQKNDC